VSKLADGETLYSHDIVVILYMQDEEFKTTYMYDNNATKEEIENFLGLSILKFWSE